MAVADRAGHGAGWVAVVSWTVLAALLAALLLGALSADRAGWPDLVAGEATYLMQAESLARDFDLTYTRADFDRFLLARHQSPRDLALASGSEGRRIAFDRPFPYALWLAPFVAWSPTRGAALANALLLTLASLLAARAFSRSLGGWGPLAVAVLVFGSVLFVYTFLTTGDLFFFTVTFLALALVTLPAAEGEGRVGPARWLAAGALLAVPVLTDPLYLTLLGAAFFLPCGGRDARGSSRAALAAGAVLAVIFLAVVQWLAGGGLPFVASATFRFTPETGYPLVDFRAEEWNDTIRRLRALYWDGAPRFAWGVDLRLWLWDALYLFLGRSIGLLPYFAPLLFLLACGKLRGPQWPLALAAVAWLAAVVIVRPFNLYGGEGAVANRLFLPLYGALWLLLLNPRPWTQRTSGAGRVAPRVAVALAVVAAAAAPFLWRLWSAPRAYPISPGEGYRHVAAAARALLPYETSQRWMPGGQVAEHNGLMVKFLNDHAWAEARRNRLVLAAPGPAEVLVGSTLPLDVLRLDFGKDAPSRIEVEGGELGERLLLPDGGISFRILLRGLVRRHPMWWTPQRQYLYRFAFEMPPAAGKELAFELIGERVAPAAEE